MPVNLKGKQYFQVAERVAAFRQECPAANGWGIATQIHAIDDAVVVVQATIRDPEGRIIGQGLAEEVRTDRGVNSTSALENCETSAIGRALAAAGWGGDGEYASANEVEGAISAQNTGRTTSAARRAAPNGKAMSDAQRDLIVQLSSSHVFSADEKKRFAGWVEKPRSSAAASATIDRLRATIEERETAESGDGSAFEPEAKLFD